MEWIQPSFASPTTGEISNSYDFTLHFLSGNQRKNLSHQTQGHTFFTMGCTCIMPTREITLCFIQENSKGQTSVSQKVRISAILTVSSVSKLMAPKISQHGLFLLNIRHSLPASLNRHHSWFRSQDPGQGPQIKFPGTSLEQKQTQ